MSMKHIADGAIQRFLARNELSVLGQRGSQCARVQGRCKRVRGGEVGNVARATSSRSNIFLVKDLDFILSAIENRRVSCQDMIRFLLNR
jgi:hypothetical protein